MKDLKLINPENASEEEVKAYATREAGRAVVVDMDGLVALLHVANESYYKLPGGGLEGNEDKIAALQRECLEEVGCDIDVVTDIGTIVEYRKIFHLKQISYCYLAKVRGEKGIPSLTEEEAQKGFRQVWLPYEEALQILSANQATSFEGKKYIVPRDTIFLEAARGPVKNLK